MVLIGIARHYKDVEHVPFDELIDMAVAAFDVGR
jgi:hypothetical protein